MRLTCPNCDAQYEVDASLVPPQGRDVQCSNCGKTWFQPKEEPAAPPPEPLLQPKYAGEAEAEAASEPAPEPDPEPESVAEPDSAPEPETEASVPDDVGEAVDEAVQQPQRTADDNILGILREEAEREIAARRAESAGLDPQQDTPASGGQAGTDEDVRSRTARLRGEAYEEPNPAPKSDVLPDIDDINATLTSQEDQAAIHAAATAAQSARRGFRAGFATVGLIVAALIIVYLFSGELAAAVPSLEPVLASYVDGANSVRIWIDGLMQRLAGNA